MAMPYVKAQKSNEHVEVKEIKNLLKLWSVPRIFQNRRKFSSSAIEQVVVSVTKWVSVRLYFM